MDLPLVYDNLPAFDLDADLPLDPPQPGMAAIYALCDPRDGAIRYIGKTIRPRQRLLKHLKACNPGLLTHKDKWIRLLLQVSLRPMMRVLEWVCADEWQTYECAAIGQALRAGCCLTNSTAGGDGVRATKEVRAKISAALTGKKLAPDRVARMSARRRGLKHKPHSEDSRRRMSQIAKDKGRRPSPQCIEASIRALTGRTPSPKSAAHLIANNKQPSDKQAKAARTRIERGYWTEERRAQAAMHLRGAHVDRAKYEEARLAGLRGPAARAKKSDAQRRLWADPEYRAMMMAARLAARTKRGADSR